MAYYSVGPTDYQIVDANSNAVYSFENENTTVSQFQTMKQEVQLQKTLNAEKVYLDNGAQTYSTNSTFPTNAVLSDSYVGSVRYSGTLNGAGSPAYCSRGVIQSIGRTPACTVMALCNLMKYYYSRGYTNIDANLATMYDTIWNYAGTNSDGITLTVRIPIAAREYLISRGYYCTYNFFLNTLYSDFTSSIRSGKPCILSYNGGQKTGHVVFVVGYVETTSAQYLSVLDGYYSYRRYLNFSGYDYSSKNGISFTITY